MSSGPTRQRYGLATGKGLEPAPGGPKTRWAKGGHVKTGTGKGMPCPPGFKKGR